MDHPFVVSGLNSIPGAPLKHPWQLMVSYPKIYSKVVAQVLYHSNAICQLVERKAKVHFLPLLQAEEDDSAENLARTTPSKRFGHHETINHFFKFQSQTHVDFSQSGTWNPPSTTEIVTCFE